MCRYTNQANIIKSELSKTTRNILTIIMTDVYLFVDLFIPMYIYLSVGM